jgi:hypothetical protein
MLSARLHAFALADIKTAILLFLDDRMKECNELTDS